jgi:hypothetical protein
MTDPVGLHKIHHAVCCDRRRSSGVHRRSGAQNIEIQAVQGFDLRTRKMSGNDGGRISPGLKPDYDLVGFDLFTGLGRILLAPERRQNPREEQRRDSQPRFAA